MTFTKEQAELHAFITGFLSDPMHDEKSANSMTAKVFRMALAALTAEPVLYAAEETLAYAKMGEPLLKCLSQPTGHAVIPLYTTPPAPVVDADDNFYSWFGREWHEHYQQDQYTTAAKQMLGVMAESAWKAGRRAAMLQGAEPVSQRDELPMDYLQGHKDGLEWAARLAEANHPQTGDWLYDDPLDLAKAIRKGPDMPVEPVLKLTFREALAAIRNLGPIDAGKIQAERDALNEPDVPDGYALVPVEPTAEMVAAAMLSDDVLFDQDDDTMFRVQHGVIWRAMLAAAPDFREISNSSTKHFRENAETSTKCWCHTCRPVTMTDARFVVCPDCGNKRCPHANDHRNACTGSNEPGQEGSAYPAAQHQEVATDNATQQFMSLGLIVTSDERKMELTRCSKHPETELQVHPLEQLMSYPPQPVMYCPLCRPSVAEWVEFDKQLRQWKEVK